MSDQSLIIPDTLNPLTVFGEGGVDDVLAKLRRDAEAQAKDLTIATEDGRKAIASIAYKVARSKTALDEMGKSLVAEWKHKAAKVDEERRRIRDECDRIKDEVRRPLTEWEEEEKRFAAVQMNNIALLDALGENLPPDLTSADIRGRLDQLKAMTAEGKFPLAYIGLANRSARNVENALMRALGEVETREVEQARRAAQEAEEAQRRQKAHDEQIAAEAAERASREAAEALEREKQRAAKEKADADARLAREKAKREADAHAAKERLAREREAATQRERERIAKEQERERQAAERREANERNRKRVAKAAVEAMVANGFLPRDAETIFSLIAEGKVPHVSVQW
jgi:colicin import membrane protein